MIKRRSLLNAILFVPAIIPSVSLMNLSWRSSKLLLPRPPLRHLSANWTIEYNDYGNPQWMIDTEVEDEIALMLRQEIDQEIYRKITREGGESLAHGAEDSSPILDLSASQLPMLNTDFA